MPGNFSSNRTSLKLDDAEKELLTVGVQNKKKSPSNVTILFENRMHESEGAMHINVR